MLATHIPLGKQGACFIAIVNHPDPNQTTTCKEAILLKDDDATLTSPAPGRSPSHQEMEDTSLHAAALICPKLKNGIEASDAQCLELLKNAMIEKDDEEVSYTVILFNSIFD